jgi:hypothetical protein
MIRQVSSSGRFLARLTGKARAVSLVMIVTVLAIAAMGCQGPGGRLKIVNVDGPTVTVSINGQDVATVRCGQSRTVALDQARPWEVRVVDGAGLELLRKPLSDDPDQGVLVRSDGALAGPQPVPGGPAPISTCPPG